MHRRIHLRTQHLDQAAAQPLRRAFAVYGRGAAEPGSARQQQRPPQPLTHKYR